MILLVGLYLDSDADRQHEFLTCIERNTNNPAIAEVHVFVEQDIDRAQLVTDWPQLASPKVRVNITGRRLTYRYLFAYANREVPGRRVVIANADIFFDHTLSRLNDYDLTGCLICLSRCDVRPDGSWQLFEFESSQDAWIFDSPIPEFECDFPLGVLGCDNRLAWEAAAAGLILIEDVRTIQKIIGQALFGATIGVGLLAVFGLIALGLASLGLYGAMAHAVTERQREIGVRMALGARRPAVLRLVLGQGLTLVGSGMACGAGASALVGQALSRVVFGVTAFDPLSMAAASLVLLLTAGAACYVPARRASLLDPLTALRDG